MYRYTPPPLEVLDDLATVPTILPERGEVY